MVRQLGDMVELAEGVLVTTILAACAWAAWTALIDVYGPVFRLLPSS